MPNRIAVTGSLNMDFVVQVERLPAPGETTHGSAFQTIPGGKGANQACAAGRLGVATRTLMLGRVGHDANGDQLKASLAAAGVDVSSVLGTQGQATGAALIWVEAGGQNSIVIAAGANGALTPADVAGNSGIWRDAAVALFQLETPLETVTAAMLAAQKAGARTILDPAPARPLPPSVLGACDILTPNETEASILLGRPPGRVSMRVAAELASGLLGLGPKSVIVKLGDQGCYYDDGEIRMAVEGFAVKAVDTTAAGDTFNGALAVALAEGRPIGESLRFANAAAALSVTKLGAQASIPSRADVDAFLAAQG